MLVVTWPVDGGRVDRRHRRKSLLKPSSPRATIIAALASPFDRGGMTWDQHTSPNLAASHPEGGRASHPEEGSTRTADGLLGRRLRVDLLLGVFAVLVLLTVLTRFVNLGARTMSHDETTHVYFSWLLEQGRGYSHDPLSHGPLQFFSPATSYFLFGDTDASARFPAAIDGVLVVLLVWAFRRWIGNLSAVVTAALHLRLTLPDVLHA